MSRFFGALLLLLVSACALAPDPVVPEGITVSPQSSGRYTGAQATYAIAAPVQVVRAALLDFNAQDYRPIVTESRTLSAGPEGGECWFRFRKTYGVAPEATCAYTVAEDGDRVLIRYEMLNPGLALMGLNGGFDLAPLDEEHTLVRQDFLISALMISGSSLVEDLREDAAAIRDHIEAAYRAR